MKIKTVFVPGDKVYWVHGDGALPQYVAVYRGIIDEIRLCEYQGALYATLYSPDFNVNPHPVVHYSHLFRTEEEAKAFADAMVDMPDEAPMCYGCKFHFSGRGGNG